MNPELTKDKVLSNLQNFGYKVPTGDVREKYVAPAGQVGGAYTNSGIISQDGTTPITPSSLAPEKPLVMPPATPVSTTVDTTAQAAATSAQSATDAQIASNTAKQELKSEGQGIMDLVNDISGQPIKQQAQYEEQGLLEKKAEIDKISLEMDQANKRAQKEIDTIQAQNPGGLIGSGASTRIRQIQRENAAYQADRAFGLAALQGNYTAAKEAIDSKIEAETSGMKLQLEAKKYFYEQNRDDFTKEEQRAYEAILRDEARVYNQTVKDKELLGETRIAALRNAQERGAPLNIISAINKAKTPEEVITAAGMYGTDLKRQLENAKLKAEAEAKTPAGLSSGKYEFGTPQYNSEIISNSSQFGKNLLQDQRNKITQSKAALSGLETINQLMSGMKVPDKDSKSVFGDGTGVLQGRLRTLASQFGGDASAAAINATIQGLIPSVARGIFNEVGVLTDADVENYKKTVGNINTPEESNKAIQYILADTLVRTYANTLTDAARNQQDVSLFADEYNNFVKRTNSLKAELTGNPFQSVASSIYDPSDGSFNIPNK